MRILIVEDEQTLCNSIKKGLINSNYAVDTANDGEEALYMYEINPYDLIVLDLNLPIIDGIEVLKRIREKDMETRILILSARSEIDDKVLGLDEGANDYLVKPFDFEELEARIRNLLRRNFSVVPSKLIVDKLQIDVNKKEVTFLNKTIPLARKEYAILEYLMIHKDEVISAEELLDHIWNNEMDPFSNVIRYHIFSLKKKLSDSTGKDFIENVRGLGYVIKEREDENV